MNPYMVYDTGVDASCQRPRHVTRQPQALMWRKNNKLSKCGEGDMRIKCISDRRWGVLKSRRRKSTCTFHHNPAHQEGRSHKNGVSKIVKIYNPFSLEKKKGLPLSQKILLKTWGFTTARRLVILIKVSRGCLGILSKSRSFVFFFSFF
jgi:hypothetical protein